MAGAPLSGPCEACGETATTRCARCKAVFFCGRECQKKAWRTHKKECFENTGPPPCSPQTEGLQPTAAGVRVATLQRPVGQTLTAGATTLQPVRLQPATYPASSSPSGARTFGIGVPADCQYEDEAEIPDPTKAYQSARACLAAFVVGVAVSQAGVCPGTWFVWSYLAIHGAGAVFFTDYADEKGLIALCGIFGMHAGVACSELFLWMLRGTDASSVGPWSIFVFFSSLLYLQNFWVECHVLPPDYVTSISFFFPMFPTYNVALALSCIELFVEWRYFPDHKLWRPAIFFGALMMAAGQAVIAIASRTAHRNFWASCRNPPPEDGEEETAGLEIPNRRIVKEGPYKHMRHPAYFGALLWGLGVELCLCNPGMLMAVAFVLWASLLYVALEEEQELYDEFRGSYAQYASLTGCWIPMFDSFLENASFQREMADPDPEEEGFPFNDEDDFSEEPEEEEDPQSEDDLLPTWEGVPKGGALWNRQFRDPWILG